MEEQLEIAENRCNTLKDQLDHMKELYQNKNDISKLTKLRTRKTYTSFSPRTKCMEPEKLKTDTEINSDDPNYSAVGFQLPCQDHCGDIDQSKSEFRHKPSEKFQENLYKIHEENQANVVVLPVRQNSHAISTDNTGAAVQTINNILTGITNSVNRLSELHVHLEKDGSISRPTSSRRGLVRDSACGDDEPLLNIDSIKLRSRTRSENPDLPEEPLQESIGDDVGFHSSSILSVKSKSKRKSKKKSLANKTQNSTITVNITNKKNTKPTAKHVEKKYKLDPVKMIGKESNSLLSPKKSKKQIRKSKNSRLYPEKVPKCSKPGSQNVDTDKLVELYHNTAAKGSETDSSNAEEHKYKTNQANEKEGSRKPASETVPALAISDVPDNYNYKQCDQYNVRGSRHLSPIEEHGYLEPVAPRTECFSTCSKNYELPTIASKMKQVAKSYMRQFNIHTIPFCAAKSTSPSHNIGINIQQVMSIIKTRQPMSGISPTLAHNIGLAAEKLHNRPFSALVSSIGSRIGYGRAQCPLIRNNLNYQQLQEMAKEIPEEPCVDADADDETKQVLQNDTTSGASGDMNRMSQQSTMWTIDPSAQRNCTCVPQHGIGFQQVLSRYHANSISASTVTQVHNRFVRQRLPRCPTLFRKIRQPLPRPDRQLEPKPSGPLKGREKNLKEVLTNLHDDFEALNIHYETLSKKVEEVGGEADEETLKELETLERSLNNKEEEIEMVMTLYKEVQSLKQQVRTLKDKASLASVALSQQQTQQTQHQYRFKDCSDPGAAVYLTKLLRQIQTYQEMYRIGRRN